jgi:hypothetical protein
MVCEAVVRLAQTLHLSCVKISTISKRTELSFHLTLVTLEYHRVRPKWFLRQCYVWHKLCTYLTPTLTLSRNGLNEIPYDPRHLVVPSGASKTISEPMVRLAKPCTYLVSRLALYRNGLKWASTWASNLGVSLGASKMVFMPMVHLAQTVHQSCTDTISKWIEMSFHLSLATKECHRVCPKWFLSLWYVCPNRALILHRH